MPKPKAPKAPNQVLVAEHELRASNIHETNSSNRVQVVHWMFINSFNSGPI